jgi:hypothetical protein
VRQLVEVQAEHDVELHQCRDVIAGQEEQLGQLDQQAAGALEAKAEVLRLAKENKELVAKALSLQVSISHGGLLPRHCLRVPYLSFIPRWPARPAGGCRAAEAADTQAASLRGSLEETRAVAQASRMASALEEFESKEMLLLDKILGLQVDVRRAGECAEVLPTGASIRKQGFFA